jgi:ribosomal subunit interface protein
MNITINAKDFNLTPSIKLYIEDKLGKLTRFSRQLKRIGVEMNVDRGALHGKVNRVEVWAYLPKITLRAGVRAEHMREAIDLVYPKIERQIVSLERKTREKKRGVRV